MTDRAGRWERKLPRFTRSVSTARSARSQWFNIMAQQTIKRPSRLTSGGPPRCYDCGQTDRKCRCQPSRLTLFLAGWRDRWRARRQRRLLGSLGLAKGHQETIRTHTDCER